MRINKRRRVKKSYTADEVAELVCEAMCVHNVPPNVSSSGEGFGELRVAADFRSCGACCDCSGCKKRATPECDFTRLTSALMRLEAAGVEVPKMHAEGK